VQKGRVYAMGDGMSNEPHAAPFDVIILGAGGAGMFCAAEAGKRGRRVALVDHNETPGRKILISGGGRCNFTNVRASAAQYLSQNTHFAKSALGRYSPADFIALVDSYGIAHHEKTLGQLFCDGSARQIVDMLVEECDKAKAAGGAVDWHMGAGVREVRHDGTNFIVRTDRTELIAPSLVVATGGPSIPKLGATAFAYELARQFGLKVVQPRPALVPLTLGGDDVMLRELSGISADVVASTGTGKSRTSFAEAALLTHRGLSGPAILQVSSYWFPGDDVALNFLPELDVADALLAAKRSTPRATIQSVLRGHLSARLADMLAEQIGIEGNLADTPDKTLRAAAARLSDWVFTPNGTEGFAKAEVTIGGVSTAELSQQTMEAKRVPGLYFVGEAVDVTGWLGGYNFQWAWASAAAAGRVV
jgi:predicted Rossmann fold flavoprotein